ncbi:methyltransferase domain-containing protein [Granulicatella sp. zg-ZJ]|nr:methyltransferase domain-containing protein [Granulicatella sp. zg-ZJ]
MGKLSMAYNKFAAVYDKLMDKSMYQQWFDYVNLIGKPNDTILELACGTGDLAVLLCKTYNVYASDLSEDMLALASQKVASIPLFQMDMCQIDVDRTFRIITCFADSLCYLKDEKSVKRAFQEAYRVLEVGGYYLFDVHSTWQMEEGYRDYVYQYCDEDTVFLWQSFPGEFPYSVEHDITCCQKIYDNEWYERFDEFHKERTYPLDSYIAWLKEAGFHTIHVTANFGQSNITETTPRWFFCCEKK